MEFRDAIQDYSEMPLTKQILLEILKDYNRPFDKISELKNQGMLIQVKRGLYVPGPKLKLSKPESILIANYLLGPSYVSLETALSHWGLIPERVYEVTSITTGPTKKYKTPVGRFSYIHMEVPYYSFGLKQIQLTKKQTALMATAEKALCDKIVTTSGILLRSPKQVLELLVEDFRIERQALRNLNAKEINDWINDAPKKNSLKQLVKTLQIV